MKKILSDRRGEAISTTAVTVIIAVVIGALLLGGLYALYQNVILPKLEDNVDQMINTENEVQVRKSGNTVQYSYDGDKWKSCSISGLSETATVKKVITHTYNEQTVYLAVINDANSRLYVSSNGTDWIPSISDSTSVSLSQSGSSLYLSCSDGRGYKSSDGINWTMTSTKRY